MAVIETVQYRMAEADLAAMKELEAWYPLLSRAAIVRLAVTELQRYVRGAKKRAEDAAILAEHRARSAPVAVAPAVGVQVDAKGREWNKRMDTIIAERKRDGLPMLAYDALLAASKE